jgi:peptide/nickel transport system substrate-binding protein
MRKLIAPALAALLLTACGGSSSSSSGGGGSSPARGTEGGGSVTIAQGVDPTTMDPENQRETTTVNVLQHFYDPLLERDATDPRKFNPKLATSWKRVNDTTTRFDLRTGVKFSDGKPFTAADVKYTVDYLLGRLPHSKPEILSYQFGTLGKVKVVDDHTVEFHTTGPDPLLLDRLTALYIIPKGAKPKSLASTPVGTGPYKLVKWDRNNQVVMRAKPDYYGGKPAIGQVTFKTMPDASARLAALESGDVDLITNLPADNTEDVKASGRARVASVPSARIASIWFNTLDSAPLKKPEVRQALNYAVDVDTIIKQVMSGYGQRVATIVAPYFADYDPSIKPFPYDPNKAKQLLAQAGYPHGFPMTLMVPEGRYEFADEVSQAIQSYLGKVGVKMKLQTVDFGVFAKATQTRKIPDGFYGAWGESFFNPIDELEVAVVSGTKGFSWFSNPEIDKLTAQAAGQLDAAKQKSTVSQIQQKMLQDPPFLFLFAYKDLYGISNRLDWKPRSDESIEMYGARLQDTG